MARNTDHTASQASRHSPLRGDAWLFAVLSAYYISSGNCASSRLTMIVDKGIRNETREVGEARGHAQVSSREERRERGKEGRGKRKEERKRRSEKRGRKRRSESERDERGTSEDR